MSNSILNNYNSGRIILIAIALFILSSIGNSGYVERSFPRTLGFVIGKFGLCLLLAFLVELVIKYFNRK